MNTGVPLNAAAVHVDDGWGPAAQVAGGGPPPPPPAGYCCARPPPPDGADDVRVTVPPTVDVAVVRTFSHA